MVEYRTIEPKDNEQVCKVIRTALLEYDGDRPGTAYHDYDTEHMFEAYQGDNEIYFVAEIDGKVVGGSGIKHLAETNENIAELQKLYLLSENRGLGIGKHLVEMCLEFANKVKYDSIYLETFPEMKAAQALYKKFGFDYIDKPMGGTGHNGCDVWMLKKMENSKE